MHLPVNLINHCLSFILVLSNLETKRHSIYPEGIVSLNEIALLVAQNYQTSAISDIEAE